MTALDRLRDALQNRGPKRSEYWWCAGEQSDALAYYLPTVKVVATHTTGGYQGDQAALLSLGPDWFLWRDGYGSCSGCDGLEGGDGFAYIKGTLTAGNVRAFPSKEAALAWLATPPTDGSWDDWSELRSGLTRAILERDA